MGLIGLIGLMRLIGLIGLIGLKARGCSNEWGILLQFLCPAERMAIMLLHAFISNAFG